MNGQMIRTVLTVSMAAAVLTGCRKELCYDHDHWKTNIVSEWEQEWERDYGRAWKQNWDSPAVFVYDSLRPVPGSGMAALVYKENDSFVERHLGSERGILPLEQGKQALLF